MIKWSSSFFTLNAIKIIFLRMLKLFLFLKNFSLFLVFAANPSKTSSCVKKNFLHSHTANFRRFCPFWVVSIAIYDFSPKYASFCNYFQEIIYQMRRKISV